MAPNDNTPTGDEVRAALERMLASPDFQAPDRLKKFLSFVVEETLAGRGTQLKGYTVGVRVFHRPDSFDPITDPIVRIQAGKLRRRLERYYLTGGAADPVRIGLPKGAYVPTFSHVTADTGTQPTAHAGPAPHDMSEPRFPGPSIAVLPFTCIGDSSETRQFAEGITEELVVGLSRFDGLAVISRQSTLRYRETTATVDEVSQILGVRFVLTGSVRKIESTIRVAAQLTDATDSAQLWADTLQRDMSTQGLFEIQDEISRSVVSQVGDMYGAIPRRIAKESRGKRPEELSAYEAALRFNHFNAVHGQQAHSRAVEALQRAVEHDPEYALAWAQLAELYVDAYAFGYQAPEDTLDSARICARRALAIDHACQHAHCVMAYVHFMSGEHSAAIREAETTIELNPNSAFMVGFAGMIIGLSGELERGRAVVDGVDALNPHEPGWLRLVVLLDHLSKTEYQEALHEARQFRTPQMAWDPLLRAATAALAGENSLAASCQRELVDIFPEVAANPAEYIKQYVRYDDLVEKVLEGLVKAARAAGNQKNTG
jgi:TolB-like protein